jgi:ABC-type lipoprotein export system ATPase subunit
MTDSVDGNYIICEDLFKIYKVADLEVVALRGLDLRVKKGELTAIVGASGSGKSTLLNILGGLDSPTAGRVTVGKSNLLKISPAELVRYRREDVGFVWQQTGRNLIPYLTAAQNVEFPLILLGWSQKDRRERAEELLEIVGLSHRKRYLPDRLSGGEQQRVAIAVALAHNPPLLLADEPTGELDSRSAATILDVFRSINETYGVTIVIVTHDLSVTNKVERVVTIRDGRTSVESIRGAATQPKPDAPPQTYDEFIVLDSAGRLQIPREYVNKFGLKGRVKLTLAEDHICVWPEKSSPEEDDK